MKRNWKNCQSFLASHIDRFIAYKRSLGRRFDVEEKTLRLFDRYLFNAKLEQLYDITPQVIERFLASRPRSRAQSYNHLLCTVRRLFGWMVAQEILANSPVQVQPKRRAIQRAPFIFDIQSAKRLLEIARRLPDRPKAPLRGVTYHAIFAILYGLGLRVGEACRLRVKDVDFDRFGAIETQCAFFLALLLGIPIGQS